MQQKLQFAWPAADVTSRSFLILDEPFSGLDPVNLELLKEIIGRIRAGSLPADDYLFNPHDARGGAVVPIICV